MIRQVSYIRSSNSQYMHKVLQKKDKIYSITDYSVDDAMKSGWIRQGEGSYF